MRKSGIFILGTILSFACILGDGGSYVADAKQDVRVLCVGGQAAGFTLKTGEIQVIGVCDVTSDCGAVSPAKNAGVRAGDCLLKVAGIKVSNIEELNELVDAGQGKTLDFELKRGAESLILKIQPIKDKITGRYKIGVLVRDTVSGIGTITYFDKESRSFGALGHSVVGENKQQMAIDNGIVYECSIVGVSKGIRGRAGELRGVFLCDKIVGSAIKLCESGIFGTILSSVELESAPSMVASSDLVKPGKAYIYSTVNGVCPQKYTLEIVKVDHNNRENKNYVIKIMDEELIAETGGIVQGMSGSPIIQGDRLVGAITHVFLNDPMRGYGIEIENMINK